MRTGPAIDVCSGFASRVSQSPFSAPSSNHDGGCALSLTLGRRFCDRRMTQGNLRAALSASAIKGSSVPRSLPIADATRSAWPDLNPGIERLRVERIAASARQPGPNRAARLWSADMCNSGPGHSNLGLGFRFHGRLGDLASRIGPRLDRNRREFGGRPKRLRRKQRLGEVKAEELAGTIFI